MFWHVLTEFRVYHFNFYQERQIFICSFLKYEGCLRFVKEHLLFSVAIGVMKPKPVWLEFKKNGINVYLETTIRDQSNCIIPYLE